MFELINDRWSDVFKEAAKHAHGELRIVCPFIKEPTISRLLKLCSAEHVQVITRFNLADFYSGVSDISALGFLLKKGATVRGVRGLHAKLYMFGPQHIVLTSANLTESALYRNKEFGFLSDTQPIAQASRIYFDELWKKAGKDLVTAQLTGWQKRIDQLSADLAPAKPRPDLGDFGAVVPGLQVDQALANQRKVHEQAFIKFFGTSTGRAPRERLVLGEVRSSGCHKVCSYPANKRPRAVNDGDRIYMSRLVEGGNDIVIFGRAFAKAHNATEDMASSADIKLRSWRKDWPAYIRVYDPEFLAGTLSNGVLLSELMAALGSDSFLSTQRNKAAGVGNVLPSKALMQKAHVQLTDRAHQWLDKRLENQFRLHGEIPGAALTRFD